MTIPEIRRYVAIGDSLSEGFSNWGRDERSIGFAQVLADQIRVLVPTLEFHNLGVSGARTAGVLHRQVERAVALKPDLLTLVVGANDVPRTPIEHFRRDYLTLLGHLRSGTGGLVLAANLPRFAHLLPAQYAAFRIPLRRRIEAFNRIIAEAAASHDVLLVDLHSSDVPEDPRNVSGDGFHPNARGYRAMAGAFAEVLNRAGFEVTAPVLDPPA